MSHMVHALEVWRSAALQMLGWAWLAGVSSQTDEAVTFLRRRDQRSKRYPVAPVSREWLRSYAASAAKRRFDR